MRFEFQVGDESQTHVVFYRNWFTGTLTITANGVPVVSRSALNPLTHFSATLTRSYGFCLDNNEANEVVIVKVRPLLFAGFRPHRYFVFWKGSEIAQYKGY
jgi:hypothetical protein